MASPDEITALLAALAGDYECDLKVSDSMEPLLAAQGIGWAKRKAAGLFNQYQKITIEGMTMKIATTTGPVTVEVSAEVNGARVSVSVNSPEAVDSPTVELKVIASPDYMVAAGGDKYTLQAHFIMPNGHQRIVDHAIAAEDPSIKITFMQYIKTETDKVQIKRIFKKKSS